MIKFLGVIEFVRKTTNVGEYPSWNDCSIYAS